MFFFKVNQFFFSQKRGGFKNKEITIYKFRSMKKIKNKMQATPLGKFLRKYKLDEIPQFYSILIGELSIVGPRPLHYEYKNIYNKKQKKKIPC